MIIEFVKKYKIPIIIILIILLLLCLLWEGHKSDMNEYEFLTQTTSITEPSNNLNLEDIIGKQLYLKYNKVVNNVVEPYYLTVVNKSKCNITDSAQDCLFNVAVLQKDKNNSAVFKIIKSFADNRYRLMSALNPTTLSNKVDMNKRSYVANESNTICFDNGEIDDIYFDIERNNGGQIRLKYRETIYNNTSTQYNYYYVGECQNLLCNNTIRLCLVDSPDKAIFFDIEDGPIQPIFTETQSVPETQSTNIAINNEADSLHSLSGVSTTTNNSNVIGIEENILQGVEKFMSL